MRGLSLACEFRSNNQGSHFLYSNAFRKLGARGPAYLRRLTLLVNPCIDTLTRKHTRTHTKQQQQQQQHQQQQIYSDKQRQIKILMAILFRH